MIVVVVIDAMSFVLFVSAHVRSHGTRGGLKRTKKAIQNRTETCSLTASR